MERMSGSGDLKRRAMVQNYLIRQPSILEEEEMGSVVPLNQVTTSLMLDWLMLMLHCITRSSDSVSVCRVWGSSS